MTGSVTPVMSVSWKPSLPISLLPTWPVMQTIGEESIIAVAMPVTMLVAPGPGRRDRDADLAARARVAVGHVRGALLVAHEHVPDRIVEHRIVGRKDGAAGVAEHGRHPFAHQAFPQDLRVRSVFIAIPHSEYCRVRSDQDPGSRIDRGSGL